MLNLLVNVPLLELAAVLFLVAIYRHLGDINILLKKRGYINVSWGPQGLRLSPGWRWETFMTGRTIAQWR